jgi:hypothetical protein
MENYIALVFLLAPGFIAKQAAAWTGNFSASHKGSLEFALSYFVYSLFALSVSTAALVLLGILPGRRFPAELADAIGNPWRALLAVGVIAAVSFALGAFWQLLAKPRTIKALNWLNDKKFGLCVEDNGGIFHNYLVSEDSAEKLLCVKKDGQETAGLFLAQSSANSLKSELALQSRPNFDAWVRYARQYPDNPEGVERKRTFFNFTDNVIIEEYDYKAGLFDKKE